MDLLKMIAETGSNVVGYRNRLEEFLSKSPDDSALANWLKDEYGLGGRTMRTEDGLSLYASWDSKGVKVSNWSHDTQQLFTWKKLAEATRALLSETVQLQLF